MAKMILEVTDVEAVLQKSNPPQLSITARGKTETPNWTNPCLRGRGYPGGTPPEDGIYDFDYVAVPPSSDYVNQVISDAPPATFEWNDVPTHFKGVRVHGQTNSVTQTI